jgi:ribosome-associated heat shock protein Hsp15
LAGPGARPQAAPEPRLRLDKWLWHARFYKSRGLATDAVQEGNFRVNGIRVSRPGREIAQGDTLTFLHGGRVRVVRILSLGQRRGPAPEAQALYADLDDGPGPAAPSPLE